MLNSSFLAAASMALHVPSDSGELAARSEEFETIELATTGLIRDDCGAIPLRAVSRTAPRTVPRARVARLVPPRIPERVLDRVASISNDMRKLS